MFLRIVAALPRFGTAGNHWEQNERQKCEPLTQKCYRCIDCTPFPNSYCIVYSRVNPLHINNLKRHIKFLLYIPPVSIYECFFNEYQTGGYGSLVSKRPTAFSKSGEQFSLSPMGEDQGCG
jgi:hypothetical protein